jgi:hypothetical protein
MKPVLLALLVFIAGPVFASTTCTSTVKQLAVDLVGEQRLFVVMATGPTLSLPTEGNASRYADAMASMSHTMGQPITAVFAGDFNCAAGGIRKDVLRVQMGD